MSTTAVSRPGFSPEEIYRAFDSGDRVAAVKMLRAETGCDLKAAMDALKDREVHLLPTFEGRAAKVRLERAAPELLEALKAVYARLPNELAQDMGWVEAVIAKATGAA